jgi:hypothetical protein
VSNTQNNFNYTLPDTFSRKFFIPTQFTQYTAYYWVNSGYEECFFTCQWVDTSHWQPYTATGYNTYTSNIDTGMVTGSTPLQVEPVSGVSAVPEPST